jgi:hypothetical protein
LENFSKLSKPQNWEKKEKKKNPETDPRVRYVLCKHKIALEFVLAIE